MPQSLEHLNAQLDALDAALPALVAQNPESADFWPAFAGAANKAHAATP